MSERTSHELYRHYDVNGVLLYVGISFCAVLRLSAHRKESGWYGEIVRVEIERFPTRYAVLVAERKAIRAENPRHNIKYNSPVPERSDIGLATDLIADAPNLLYFERIQKSYSILSRQAWYNLGEASGVLGLDTQTIKELLEAGELKGWKTKGKGKGPAYKFSAWQLLEYLESIHMEAEAA